MTKEELEKIIKDLTDRLDKLERRRIIQSDLLPDVVKMRHVGESVRYIRGGTEDKKPTIGEEPMQGIAIYYDIDNKILYCWNTSTSTWDYVQFS